MYLGGPLTGAAGPGEVVSTLSAEPARRAALAAGTSDFLCQPFEAAALLDLIQSHVPMPPAVLLDLTGR